MNEIGSVFCVSVPGTGTAPYYTVGLLVAFAFDGGHSTEDKKLLIRHNTLFIGIKKSKEKLNESLNKDLSSILRPSLCALNTSYVLRGHYEFVSLQLPVSGNVPRVSRKAISFHSIQRFYVRDNTGYKIFFVKKPRVCCRKGFFVQIKYPVSCHRV